MAHGGQRRGAGRPTGEKAQKSADLVAAQAREDRPAEPASAPNLITRKIKLRPAEIKLEKIKLDGHGGSRPGAGRPGRKPAAPKSERIFQADQPAPPPPHGSDATLGRRVALCAGSGMDVLTIAAALQIEESRLRVEFAHELANGSAIVQADNLAALSAAAADGNAAAAKALLSIAMKAGGPPPGAPAIRAGGDATARALRILQGGKP